MPKTWSLLLQTPSSPLTCPPKGGDPLQPWAIVSPQQRVQPWPPTVSILLLQAESTVHNSRAVHYGESWSLSTSTAGPKEHSPQEEGHFPLGCLIDISILKYSNWNFWSTHHHHYHLTLSTKTSYDQSSPTSVNNSTYLVAQPDFSFTYTCKS